MKILRMREIARRLGVCAGTVRNWERKGIIVFSRDTAGNRYCTEADWAELERRCADARQGGCSVYGEGIGRPRRAIGGEVG